MYQANKFNMLYKKGL